MRVVSHIMRFTWKACLLLPLTSNAFAENAYTVFGKTKTLETVKEEKKDQFYELEKQIDELVRGSGKEEYLKQFWDAEGKKQKKSPEQARDAYMKQHVKVNDAEVKDMLKKYANHPNLKDLSEKEKTEQIRNFLQQKGEAAVMQNVIDEGMKNGNLKFHVEPPKEPVYKLTITDKDHLRYGPAATDVNPMKGGCTGDNCKITIVEYSEYQCPFCARVLPTVKQVMEEYKGKIRWVVRDFPLSFHPRARPAAIAAKCAAKQGKYWDMYYSLFENQQKLGDTDIKQYAEKLKLDTKAFGDCVAKPQEVEQVIDANLNSGMAMGVSGTPAFFINGRRLSGALPFEEFKRVIDEELKKNS